MSNYKLTLCRAFLYLFSVGFCLPPLELIKTSQFRLLWSIELQIMNRRSIHWHRTFVCVSLKMSSWQATGKWGRQTERKLGENNFSCLQPAGIIPPLSARSLKCVLCLLDYCALQAPVELSHVCLMLGGYEPNCALVTCRDNYSQYQQRNY